MQKVRAVTQMKLPDSNVKAPISAEPEAKTDLRRLLGENLRQQWRTYSIAAFAMVIVAAMTSATALMMQGIVDTMTRSESSADVYQVATLVALIFAVRGVATYVQLVMMNRAGMRIVAKIQRDLYQKLLHQGIAFFNTSDSSTLVLRITQGANAARNVVNLIVSSYVRDVLSVVFLVAVMIYQQPFLTLGYGAAYQAILPCLAMQHVASAISRAIAPIRNNPRLGKSSR
ncbi:MAG: ABC transporter transmembrane domain-containing protein [Cypionkella sp.]|nr:ABC transporter transmembrane domain-containing protein [Cypionkella sp.]